MVSSADMDTVRSSFSNPRDERIAEAFASSPGDQQMLDLIEESRLNAAGRPSFAEDIMTPLPTHFKTKPRASTSQVGDDDKNSDGDEGSDDDNKNGDKKGNRRASGVKGNDSLIGNGDVPKIVFSRKPPPTGPSAAPAESGIIAKQLKSMSMGGAAGGASMAAGGLKVIIYLPDRSPLKLVVPKNATVVDAIRIALAQASAKNKKLNLPLKSYLYELRIHDSDGMPDDDLPALDRDSKIRDLADSEEDRVYCLTENPDGVEGSDKGSDDITGRSDNTAAIASKSPVPANIPVAGAPKPRNSRGSMGPNHLKIIYKDGIGGNDVSSTIAVDMSATCQQFLAKFIARKGLPLSSDTYQLRVTPEDQQRLSMLSPVIDPNTELMSLGVTCLELWKRRYRDQPPEKTTKPVDQAKQVQSRQVMLDTNDQAPKQQQAAKEDRGYVPFIQGPIRRQQSGPNPAPGNTTQGIKSKESNNDMSTDTKGVRKTVSQSNPAPAMSGIVGKIDPDSIPMNDILAAKYEEFTVRKTNKWHKDVPRKMAIDYQKIYNKHPDGKEVKKPERFISDVTKIRLNTDDPRRFLIHFRDGPGGTETVHEYEAEDALSAAQIVAKVTFIKGGRVNT